MRRSTRSSSSSATLAYSTFSDRGRVLPHLLHQALGRGDRVADLVRDGRRQLVDAGLLLGLHHHLLAPHLALDRRLEVALAHHAAAEHRHVVREQAEAPAERRPQEPGIVARRMVSRLISARKRDHAEVAHQVGVEADLGVGAAAGLAQGLGLARRPGHRSRPPRSRRRRRPGRAASVARPSVARRAPRGAPSGAARARACAGTCRPTFRPGALPVVGAGRSARRACSLRCCTARGASASACWRAGALRSRTTTASQRERRIRSSVSTRCSYSHG